MLNVCWNWYLVEYSPMNRCFMSSVLCSGEISPLCPSWTTPEDTTWCFRVAPGHGSSLAPGQRSLEDVWGTTPHRLTLQIYTVLPTAARLFGVNVLQCVNIEIFVLLSSPVLTAQQGSSCCCLYLCKLSLMKPSHQGHRQMSSFCNGDVCLFAIN